VLLCSFANFAVPYTSKLYFFIERKFKNKMAHHRILEDRLKEQQPQGGFTIDSRRFQPAAMKEKAVFPKKCDEP
jgi:hypothetical protein